MSQRRIRKNKNVFSDLRRRQGWMLENSSLRKLCNLALCATHYALKREVMRAWPVIVKVDISPLCNLRCTFCVHAMPHNEPALERQQFRRNQFMPVERFEQIAAEIDGKSSAVSLYYLGDPLTHPELAGICESAWKHRLNSHISTNLSFRMTDKDIERLVTSGLTHLTVCVDGLTQANYERTRVGGKIELVLNNLRRIVECKRHSNMKYPKVEAQFLKFQHNVHELPAALDLLDEIGVDQVTDFWGFLARATFMSPGGYDVTGPREDKVLPACYWPYMGMQIKYNGDVIPCCTYRTIEQYQVGADPRVLGNVFDTSVWEVWNSAAYRQIRRFVGKPSRVLGDPSLTQTFCHECPELFVTNSRETHLTGDKHRWEDHYERDERGRVRPRRIAELPVLQNYEPALPTERELIEV